MRKQLPKVRTTWHRDEQCEQNLAAERRLCETTFNCRVVVLWSSCGCSASGASVPALLPLVENEFRTSMVQEGDLGVHDIFRDQRKFCTIYWTVRGATVIEHLWQMKSGIVMSWLLTYCILYTIYICTYKQPFNPPPPTLWTENLYMCMHAELAQRHNLEPATSHQNSKMPPKVINPDLISFMCNTHTRIISFHTISSRYWYGLT